MWRPDGALVQEAGDHAGGARHHEAAATGGEVRTGDGASI